MRITQNIDWDYVFQNLHITDDFARESISGGEYTKGEAVKCFQDLTWDRNLYLGTNVVFWTEPWEE